MDASAEVAEAPAIAAAETTAPAVAVGAPPADTINGESGETEVAAPTTPPVDPSAELAPELASEPPAVERASEPIEVAAAHETEQVVAVDLEPQIAAVVDTYSEETDASAVAVSVTTMPEPEPAAPIAETSHPSVSEPSRSEPEAEVIGHPIEAEPAATPAAEIEPAAALPDHAEGTPAAEPAVAPVAELVPSPASDEMSPDPSSEPPSGVESTALAVDAPAPAEPDAGLATAADAVPEIVATAVSPAEWPDAPTQPIAPIAAEAATQPHAPLVDPAPADPPPPEAAIAEPWHESELPAAEEEASASPPESLGTLSEPQPAEFLLEPMPQPAAPSLPEQLDPVGPTEVTAPDVLADIDQELFEQAPAEAETNAPPQSTEVVGHVEPLAAQAPVASMSSESVALTSAPLTTATAPSITPPQTVVKPMPRSTPNDPLAALKAMSDEERIALFT